MSNTRRNAGRGDSSDSLGLGGDGRNGSRSSSRTGLRERPLPNPGKSSSESMNIPPPIFHSEDEEYNDRQDEHRSGRKDMRYRQNKTTDDRRGSLESLRPNEVPSMEVIKTIIGRDDVESLRSISSNMTLAHWNMFLSNSDSNIALIAAKIGSFKCVEWMIRNVPDTMERFLLSQDSSGQSIIHHLVMNSGKGGARIIQNLYSERSNILTATVNYKNKASNHPCHRIDSSHSF